MARPFCKIGWFNASEFDPDDDQPVANPSELVELVDTGWSKVQQSVPDIAAMSRVTNAFQERTAEGQHFRLIASIGAVVVFGCLAVLPVEFLIQEDKAAMAVGVVANYSFVIVTSLASKGTVLLTNPKVPLRRYAMIVVSSCAYQALQAYAFTMGLTMPVALVVKNGGLLCQMVVGSLCLHENYTAMQTMAAMVITGGIIVTVFANSGTSESPEGLPPVESAGVVLGASVLVVGMLLRSFGNSAVQGIYREYGKHFHEVLFYQHALGLPLLLLNGQALWLQCQALSPMMWCYLTASMVLNYIVTKSCTMVNALSSSVALNLVLTSQRFVSIVISATVINAPPYPPRTMWLGAGLVVCGCASFVLAPKPSKREHLGNKEQGSKEQPTQCPK